MNTLVLIPKDVTRLKRLADLAEKYKGFKMFDAERLFYSGEIFRITEGAPGGNLSGRLYIHFNISGFTLYLMNGYLQPLGEYLNNTFTPSPLGTFYNCEIKNILKYLFTHGLFTNPKG